MPDNCIERVGEGAAVLVKGVVRKELKKLAGDSNQDDFQNGAAGTVIALKYKAEPNIQGNC
ncbi:hypothetical protein BG000_004748 [Podila horticola]|nr:hypothetical protein BG000_004748 [Podila horticola]